jgi:hypothetical protein
MYKYPKGILLINGTLCSGKTAVAIEIGRQLESSHIPCAVIDLDWLNWVCLNDGFDSYDQLAIQNLLSMWPNLSSVGVDYLILARALLDAKPVETLKHTWPGTPITVVRLLASPYTIKERLKQRDAAHTLQEHLDEVDAVTASLDTVKLEQSNVVNENRSIEDVAGEVITITGWDPH